MVVGHQQGALRSLSDRLHRHLLEHPIGRLLFEEAEPDEKDTRSYSHLPYHSTAVSGNAWIVVGDAAGFIDLLYSQGLDFCGHTVYAAHRILLEALGGDDVTGALRDFNSRFQDSYRRWYEALCKDKYYYIGDFELMSFAFKFDLGFYYLGAVSRPYLLGAESLTTPSFGQDEGKWPAIFLSFYNRRLAKIARKRLASGRWGRRNHKRFDGFFSYRLNWTLPARLLGTLLAYALFEFVELFANLKKIKNVEGDPLQKQV